MCSCSPPCAPKTSVQKETANQACLLYTSISGPNIYGKQTVAVADGTVAFVQTTYTPGKGYGKYIIVDHGGGITTLYGHNSAILVSVGQKVTRGQALTQIGSTGWSTGPHLHFEVRVNGKHVNPWTYLK